MIWPGPGGAEVAGITLVARINLGGMSGMIGMSGMMWGLASAGAGRQEGGSGYGVCHRL